MPSDTLVMVEHEGFARTRRTSISDNTPDQAGYIPLLDSNGRINNNLLEDTLRDSKSLRWNSEGKTLKISDGSEKKGPSGETFTDNKDPNVHWAEGLPVLFGYNSEGRTVGVRVDTARNADSLTDTNADPQEELFIGPSSNNVPKTIVRTDDKGYFQTDYAFINGAEETVVEDVKNLLFTGSDDTKIRKGHLKDMLNVFNLEDYCYSLRVTSSNPSVAGYVPVEFKADNVSIVITNSNNRCFCLKIDAVTATEEASSPFTAVYHSVDVKGTGINSYVRKIINTRESKAVIVYLASGFEYKVYNVDRNTHCKGRILTDLAPITETESLPAKNWFISGNAEITPDTSETYLLNSNAASKSTGWGNDPSTPYDGETFRIARADHTHYYDVNSTELKTFSNNKLFVINGKSTPIVFRTENFKDFSSMIDPYKDMNASTAFAWYCDSNKVMHLTPAGDLYPNRCFHAVYADLAECFLPETPEVNMNTEYPNRIVEIAENGKIRIANSASTRCVGVISNSYGTLLNGTEEEVDSGKKVPVAMAGTVLVDAENIEEGKIGDRVCAGKDGKAKITTDRDVSVGKIVDFVQDKYKIIISL